MLSSSDTEFFACFLHLDGLRFAIPNKIPLLSIFITQFYVYNNQLKMLTTHPEPAAHHAQFKYFQWEGSWFLMHFMDSRSIYLYYSAW